MKYLIFTIFYSILATQTIGQYPKYSLTAKTVLDEQQAIEQIDRIKILLETDKRYFIRKIDLVEDTVFSTMNKLQEEYFKLMFEEDFNKIDMNEFTITKEHFADFKEPFNATDVMRKNLPRKQLQFAIKGKDCYVILYEHGGLAYHPHLVFIDLANPVNSLTLGSPPYYVKKAKNIGKYLDSDDVIYFRKAIYSGNMIDDIF